MIILLIIWLVLSIYAIYYVDHNCYWEHLYKIFICTSLLALLFDGWKVYDASLNNMIVTIETNPTWELALGLSFIKGTCITGLIAGIYILKEKIQERRG